MFGEIIWWTNITLEGSFPTFDAGDALACDVFGQLRQGGGRGHPGGGGGEAYGGKGGGYLEHHPIW